MAADPEQEILSLPGPEIIEFNIGKKQKKVSIHENLLANASPYFKEKIDKLSPTCRKMYMKDEYYGSLELLQGWLYRRKLNLLGHDDKTKWTEDSERYIRLYLHVIEWNIPKLQNCTMDTLRASNFGVAEQGHYVELIRNIYSHSPESSPLRKYIVDSFLLIQVARTGTDSTFSLKKFLLAHLERSNDMFVADCYVALFKLQRNVIPPLPNLLEGCVYRVHEDGERCGRELKKE